jgi:hypothetical protein
VTAAREPPRAPITARSHECDCQTFARQPRGKGITRRIVISRSHWIGTTRRPSTRSLTEALTESESELRFAWPSTHERIHAIAQVRPASLSGAACLRNTPSSSTIVTALPSAHSESAGRARERRDCA